MLHAELSCWHAALAIEAALITRLLCCRAGLKMFLIYLMFDLPRWMILSELNGWGTSESYRAVFFATEPISIALLACMGLESAAAAYGATISKFTYCILAVGTTLFTALAPGVGDQDEKYFIARATVEVLIILSVVAMGAHRSGVHGAILTGFCVFDVIQNVAIVNGAKGDVAPGAVLVFEQTACLILWLAYAKSISQQYSDSKG